MSEIEKKMTDHDHDKYITTPEFNKLTAENFAARLAQANLVTKADFHNKLMSLNRKINSNKTKHLLVVNELKNYKRLIHVIFEVNSDVMILKIILYFSQYSDILKRLVMLIVF